MNGNTERRRTERDVPRLPHLGFIQVHPSQCLHTANLFWDSRGFYLNVVNRSERGCLVESPEDLEEVPRLVLLVYDFSSPGWAAYQARPVWTRKDPHQDQYTARLEFLCRIEDATGALGMPDDSSIPTPRDFEFLINTSVLGCIPEHTVSHLMNCLRIKKLKAGDRLFSQGDTGDALYIIQNGKCSVFLEKDSKFCNLTQDQGHEHLISLPGQASTRPQQTAGRI